MHFTRLLVALLLLAAPAHAQAPQSRGVVRLAVGEGRLMRIDHDAANVLIADPSVSDVQVVSPRTLFVFGRKPGQTTLSATDAESGVVAQLVLRVVRSAAAAQAALPPGGGTSLGFEGDRIVVRGSVGDLGQALDASSTARAYSPGGQPPLDRSRLAGAQQVTLRVRIAEASRTTLDQLGLNLGVLANPGSFAFRLVTGGFVGAAVNSLSGAATGTGGTGLSTSLSGLNGTGTFGQLGAGVTTGRVNANALLNALQSEGLVTSLAEPNLTTISGETARFNAGGEVPILVP